MPVNRTRQNACLLRLGPALVPPALKERSRCFVPPELERRRRQELGGRAGARLHDRELGADREQRADP
eukprot:66015-Rhodomonas_salina.1